MKKALLIAEKPNLAKDIEKVYKKMSFKDDITFVALSGHVLGLKYPGEYDSKWEKWNLQALPIVPDKFEYKLDRGKSHFYNQVKDEVKSGKYDYIINACDAAREGELIFFSVFNYIGSSLPIKRLWISDTTDVSIERGLNNLIDESDKDLLNLKDSAFLRSYFDWLIGINLSRAVSLKTNASIPVGRVLTPTLAIIVNRENEILNFNSEDYWTIDVFFGKYQGSWINKKTKNTKINNKSIAEKTLDSITRKGKVTSVNKQLVTTYAPGLYSLLTLQKDANKYYGYTASETLGIAQKLYDELKLISYPRTESSVISTNMINDIEPLLSSLNRIKEYEFTITKILNNKSNIKKTLNKKTYVDNTKLTDHHAIIPTTTQVDLSKLGQKERNIYELILKRFLAIFMNPYQFNKSTILIESNNNLIKVNGKVLVSNGYRALYNGKEKDVIIPNLSENDIVTIEDKKIYSKQTTPPSRYNDSSLLDSMANAGRMVDDKDLKDILKKTKGIGTSATRDSFIEKLIKSKMIERKGKTIYPTKFGMDIIEILKGKDIISPSLTAMWEEKLGNIENGKLSYDTFYKDMLDYTKEQTINTIKDVTKTLGTGKKERRVLGTCPKCGEGVIDGKKFYLCTKYKDGCDFLVGKKILNANIGIKDIKAILNKKETVEKTFIWKSGKRGKAKLKLNDKNKLEFIFK